MHGQRREEYKAKQRDPQVAAKLQQKAQQWRQLTAQLPQAPPNVAWELTETLLRVNPDPLYIWNHRRKLFLEKTTEQDDDDNETLIEKELTLTAASLQNNPKSYGAWFHRKWVLCQATRMAEADKTTKVVKDLLREELRLTELFLQRDERNFHCWSYRRFVVSLQMDPLADGTWWLLSGNDQQHNTPSNDDENDHETSDTVLRRKAIMGVQIVLPDSGGDTTIGINTTKTTSSEPTSRMDATTASHLLQAEWEFTRAKISQNFSNFSAFHYRSKLLLLLWPRVDMSAEIQLVEDAIYTEPDDQTAWWYQAFLLDTIQSKQTVESYQDRLQQHLKALEELAEEVSECKWVRLGLIACLKLLPGTKDRLRDLWQALIDMDPDRKVRYEYMRAKADREEPS
jgi:hypothetical protein